MVRAVQGFKKIGGGANACDILTESRVGVLIDGKHIAVLYTQRPAGQFRAPIFHASLKIREPGSTGAHTAECRPGES